MGFSSVQPAFIFKNRSPNNPHDFFAGSRAGRPALPDGRDLSGTTSTSTSLRSFRKTFTASKESSDCTGGRASGPDVSEPRHIEIGFSLLAQVRRAPRRRKRRQLLCFDCNDGDWCFDRRSGGFYRWDCPSGLVRRHKWIFRRTKFGQINLFFGAIGTFATATQRQTFSGSQQGSKFHNHSISLKASGANAASAA